ATNTAAPQRTGTAGQPTALKLAPNQARIVDPSADRADARGAEKTIDGNDDTSWKTVHYNGTNFGNLKPGMGVLLDLGAPKVVTYVNVLLNASGSTIELRSGDSDPGATTAGDTAIATTFKQIGDTKADSPSRVTLPGGE